MKKTIQNNLQDLLVKYATGVISDHELEELTHSLKDKSKATKIKRYLDKDWKSLVSDHSTLTKERIDMSFESILLRVQQAEHKRQRWRMALSKIAAAFIGVVVLAGVLWQRTQNASELSSEMHMVQTAVGEQKTIMLPDGSKVFLNVDSQLSYPKTFSGDLREVFLEGEAFFEVQKNAQKAFVVQSGNLQTRVLGTSFNINAYEANVTVSVATGQVRVSSETLHALLKPGQQASYKERFNEMTTSVVSAESIASWRTGHVQFTQTPLSEVIEAMERWHDVRLEVIDADMERCLVHATLDLNDLEACLDVLAYVLHAEFEYKDHNHILLRGGICANDP